MKKTKRRGNALQETWKPVVGYRGLYEVSDLGRIQSLHGHSRQVGHVLLASEMGRAGKGYLGVSLCRNDTRRSALVHNIVMRAFVGPKRGREVDHIDTHKTNNRLDNLEYVTPRENYRRAQEAGLMHKAHGEAHGHATITEADVREIRRLKRTGQTQRSIAEQLGLSEFHVSKICRGVLWGHVK